MPTTEERNISIPRLLLVCAFMGAGLLLILIGDLRGPEAARGLRDFYSKRILPEGQFVQRDKALEYGRVLQSKTEGLYGGRLLPAALIFVGGILNGRRRCKMKPEPADR